MVQTHSTFHPCDFPSEGKTCFWNQKKEEKAKPWMNLTSTRPGQTSPQNQNDFA